jgi:hypothetical protein
MHGPTSLLPSLFIAVFLIKQSDNFCVDLHPANTSSGRRTAVSDEKGRMCKEVLSPVKLLAENLPRGTVLGMRTGSSRHYIFLNVICSENQ